MSSPKDTKKNLIEENNALKVRLQHAEAWMRREVQQSKNLIQKENIQRETRAHFDNTFEAE